VPHPAPLHRRFAVPPSGSLPPRLHPHIWPKCPLFLH
jgi:hypothetical protein